MNFHSSVYDWLVIAGARAQYKGSGTINGSGDYGFMLTAIDGQVNGGGGVDKFRIKIWNKSGGGMVYDNQMGGSDDDQPTTSLGGGSIVIHKGSPQLALGGQQVGGSGTAAITTAEVSAVLPAAIDRWAATGLSAADVARLQATRVEVADLPDGYLGAATLWGDVISIDVNAAGYGWFVDRTPWDDVEFADPKTSGAADRMDLLTVVMHELGHVLGLDSNFDGDSSDLMTARLATGVRRTASQDAVAPEAPGQAMDVAGLVDRRWVDRRSENWLWMGSPRGDGALLPDWLADDVFVGRPASARNILDEVDGFSRIDSVN